MEDILEILSEINSLLNNIPSKNKNIYNHLLSKIYYDLEQIKFLISNDLNLPPNQKEILSNFKLEIQKRDKIIKDLMPLLISTHFLQTPNPSI